MERNLLIVDDEDEILSSLTRELRKNYTIHAAHGAEEGFALLGSHDIHVILADQRMPGITGTAFFTRVRQDYPAITRLLMTGYTDIESIIEAVNNCHIFRYIRKPWNSEELPGILHEACAHHDMLVSQSQRVNTLEAALKEHDILFSSLLNANRESLFLMDMHGTVLAMNNACAERLGIDPESAVGSCACDLLPPEVAEERKLRMEEVIATKKSLSFQDCRSGRIIENHLYPVLDDRGEVYRLSVLGIDITERVRAGEEIRRQKELLQAIIDHIPVMITCYDPLCHVTEVNREFEKLTGWSPGDARNNDLMSLCYPDPLIRQEAADFMVPAKPGWKDFTITTKAGTLLQSAWSNVLLSDGHQVGIGIDITERKLVEEEIRRHRDGLEALVEERTIALKEANRMLQAEILERKRSHEILAEMSDLKEELLREGALEARMKRITDGVVRFFDADLARLWIIREGDLCARGCHHALNGEPPGTCRQEARCLHLVASSGRYTHMDGGHGRVPLGFYKIGRVATAEDTGFVTNDLLNDPLVHDKEWALSRGLVSFAGQRLLSSEGKPLGVLALFTKSSFGSDNERLLKDIAHCASHVIITGMAEEKVRASLREKEVLLREIHHRVKNSLTMVSSLLSLQARQFNEPLLQQAFKESQARVKSIALVHEKLYRSESLGKIDLGSYLERIADDMRRIYGRGGITLDVHAQPVFMGPDRAIPLGLIINELITNAFKYAFPGGRSGAITVELCSQGEKAAMIKVHDNGAGLPRSVDLEKPASLGLELVNALVVQIGGTIDMARENGTTFIITFPIHRDEEPQAP